MIFSDALRAFSTGAFDEEILHPETGLRLPDKTLLCGPDAVAGYLNGHPEFFQGFLQISPDSPVTVTFRNASGSLVKVFSFEGRIGKIVEFRPDEVRQRIKLTLEYDGTDFRGFQRQKEDRTVQGELEAALSVVNGEPTPVTGASRTDAGVHALGQVAHFDTHRDFSEEKWEMVLNHALPKDIVVRKVQKVHPLFHSRYDVLRKEYRYVLRLGEPSALDRNREWAVPGPLDLSRLAGELKKIEGTRDFASFCKGENDDTVRTVFETRMETSGGRILLTFVGDGFLHNMIRLLVGSMVDIASGKTDDDLSRILSERNRNSTRSLAPAGGLYLVRIDY